MPLNRDAIAIAWKHHRAGDDRRAEHLCRQLLAAQPDEPELHFLFGTIAHTLGRSEEAAASFRRAIELKPDYPEAHNNLGNALAALSQFAEAEACYRRALALKAAYPEAHNNLGNVLRRLKRDDEAAASFQRALELRPNYAQAHSNLGNTLRELGRLDEAAASFRRALAIKPEYPEARNNLGIVYAAQGKRAEAIAEFEQAAHQRPKYSDALGNLGLALLEDGQAERAVDILKQSLTLRPNAAGVHDSLGTALAALGRYDEALRSHQNAIRLAPDFAEAHGHLGSVLRDQGRVGESLAPLEHAVRMRPDHAELHYHYGLSLVELGRLEEAARELSEATRLRPSWAEAHVSLAETWLAMGELQRAWPEYAWRRRLHGTPSHPLPQPLWDGETLAGRTILLEAEATLGETIQFARFAALAKAQGARVALECPAGWVPLLTRCRGIDQLVARGEAPRDFDVRAPLGLLPAIFSTALENLPAEVPCLSADPGLAADWGARLGRQPGYHVGIAWQGTTRRPADRRRWIPLVHFAAAACLPGVRAISLQKGPAADELRAMASRVPIVDLGESLDEAAGALVDTAAVIENLDLVITADTVIAHLAGALGVEAWVLLPFAADWEWMHQRADSPWYPTLRLFRQERPGDWQGVLDRVVEELRSRCRDLQACSGASVHYTDIPASPVREADPLTRAARANDLGIDRARQGRHDEAVACYRQALELRGDFPEAHNNLANALRNLGRASEAIEHYQTALALRPDYAEAHNNLGIAWASQGKHAEAIECFREAVRLKPTYAHALGNLGTAHLESGRVDEAIAPLEEAIRVKPDFAKAHNALGNARMRRRQWAEAEASYREAVRIEPGYAEAWNSLGNSLREQDKLEEAIHCFREALRLKPDYVDAYNAMGITYGKQEKCEEAVECYRNALRLNPGFPDALNNPGIVLARLGNAGEAIESYRQAIRLRPQYAEAHNNLGIVLTEQWRHEEAKQCFAKALELRPNYAAAHSNLGIALTEQGQVEPALGHYREALRLESEYADAHMNYALALLARGDFEPGWEEYEWRWRCKGMKLPPFEQPLWDGSPLDGRTIALHYEQGLGDTLQFVRYAPLVKRQGGTVILLCQKSLIPLLKRTPGIDRLMPKEGELPACDVHLPLLSLPRIFKTTVTSVPHHVPYLIPDPRLVERWRQEFRPVRDFKVGISWQGNPKYRGDRHRSVPLLHFAALARVEGVRLYGLQKGFGTEQLAEVEQLFSVTNLGEQLDKGTGAFVETAAVMANLDLVVTSDTALVHVAGGLGVPVFMPLPQASDWRWMLQREDSPWYPTMRIFRQGAMGNWPEVCERMAAALAERVAAARQRRPVAIEVAPGELIDKITILEIKRQQLSDEQARRNVEIELDELVAARDWGLTSSAALEGLTNALRGVNRRLWDIEDAIRRCERDKDFGTQFIELARSVYKMNDQRAALKRKINLLLGSRIVEEKDYVRYEEPNAAEGAEVKPDGQIDRDSGPN